jgi:ABC-type phosphate transport system substrate-binding protein
MKSNIKSMAVLSGLILATAAQAQVELTITGASAFRLITVDRAISLFDNGYVAITNNASTAKISVQGTVQNKIPALGSTLVTVRMSFTGSAQGMMDVLNQAPINTAAIPTGTTNTQADCAFSDVYPISATPPITSGLVEDVVGVVPMVFVKNNGLAGINNITRDQANLLMTSSGDLGMPATYLGGSSPNPVYLIGRDASSGTRITVEKCIGFTGAPTLWQTNGVGAYVNLGTGYSSGGLVKNVVQGKADAIGYMSLGDYTGTFTNAATVLGYNGVPFSIANVETGAYAIWGYEHLVYRVGGLSANQQLVFNALKNAIKDPAFQGSSTLYYPNYGQLGNMKVQRGADGGIITSLEF